MRLRIQKTRQVKTPTRSHEYDAGLDFYIPDDMPWDTFAVWPHNSLLIPTGIKVDIPDGFALFCFERSSIAKKGLVCGARVCDAGYQGEIHMQVINVGKDQVYIKPGEKLCQFILLPVVRTELVVVSDRPLFNEQTERGEGGFGSTGTGLPKKVDYKWDVEQAIQETKKEFPNLTSPENIVYIDGEFDPNSYEAKIQKSKERKNPIKDSLVASSIPYPKKQKTFHVTDEIKAKEQEVINQLHKKFPESKPSRGKDEEME